MAFHPDYFYPITAITTSTYQWKASDNGKIFTNRGGGALTPTLPAVASLQAGWHIWYFHVAAGDLVITAPADTLSAFNDATATTATYSTNGEEIGNGFFIVFDGTTFLLFVMPGAEAVTATVA